MTQDVGFESVLRRGVGVQVLVASARSKWLCKSVTAYISGSGRSSSSTHALTNVRHDIFAYVVGADKLELV